TIARVARPGVIVRDRSQFRESTHAARNGQHWTGGHSMRSQLRLRLTMGASFALFASTVFAQSTEPAAQAPQVAPAARVAIDRARGKMRPVEHDDAVQAGKPKANTAARSLVQTQGAPRPIISSQGVRGRVLDRSSMTYTVVRRNAEGGLDS